MYATTPVSSLRLWWMRSRPTSPARLMPISATTPAATTPIACWDGHYCWGSNCIKAEWANLFVYGIYLDANPANTAGYKEAAKSTSTTSTVESRSRGAYVSDSGSKREPAPGQEFDGVSLTAGLRWLSPLRWRQFHLRTCARVPRRRPQSVL